MSSKPSKNSLGIDHIGVAVLDLDAAENTYVTTLGFTCSGRETLKERGLEVSFIETGTGRIELIAPTRDNSEVSRFLEKRGEGVHHICVRVRDIESAIERITQNGGQLINRRPQQGANNTQVAFIHPKGAHGVLMELVQYAEGTP